MFILPNVVIREVERLRRSFLWKGHEKYSRGGNVKWENVCRPKNKGGLGLKKIHEWYQVREWSNFFLGFFHNYPKTEVKQQKYPKFSKFTRLPYSLKIIMRLPFYCGSSSSFSLFYFCSGRFDLVNGDYV